MDNNEIIRPISFFLIIIIIFFFEKIRPAFKNINRKRLFTNIALFGINILLLKVCFPFGIYKLIPKLAQQDYFLLNIGKLPFALSLIVTIILFDIAIYWQHRFFHIIKPLWKLHAVHHCDTEMDFTMALRFHPIEIIISAIYKIILIMILGPNAMAYLIYEVILNSMAIFNHGNIKISPTVDRYLRLIIVTPNMHYPHHSPDKKLTNQNYGNFLSFWDKLFKSYTSEECETFGLDYIDEKQAADLKEQLQLPFTLNH